jgi:hypothetical protein
MNPPICKLCGTRHWTYDAHTIKETCVPEYVKEMARGVVGLSEGAKARDAEVPNIRAMGDDTQNNRTEMNKRTNKRTRGRPRKWASEAERLRAYRERSG